MRPAGTSSNRTPRDSRTPEAAEEPLQDGPLHLRAIQGAGSAEEASARSSSEGFPHFQQAPRDERPRRNRPPPELQEPRSIRGRRPGAR